MSLAKRCVNTLTEIPINYINLIVSQRVCLCVMKEAAIHDTKLERLILFWRSYAMQNSNPLTLFLAPLVRVFMFLDN